MTINANDNAVVRYATVCSGIEGVTAAWEPLGGFEPVFFSEIAKFQSSFLKDRFPSVINLGDLTKIDGAKWKGKVDVLWGSTPCQAFSAAGNRTGLSDPRGALTLSFVNLADAIDPPFITWENVKRVLSSADNAYGQFLGALAGSGRAVVSPSGSKWGDAGFVRGPRRTIAWRTFDAKFGGVPQQRRRVFVVACPTGGADPRDLLFERETVRGHPSPCGAGTTGYPATLGSGAEGPIYFNCDSRPKFSTEFAHPLKADTGSGGRGCILANDNVPRRLTPLECERLMGFPDGWTDIPGATDAQRWSALGNSLAIPDVRWIGERIKASVEEKLARHHWPDLPRRRYGGRLANLNPEHFKWCPVEWERWAA